MITGKELAQKILTQITEHPETHDQYTWVDSFSGCGTTRCIAGWAVALNAEPGEAVSVNDFATRARLARELGVRPHWATLGQELLGLSEEEAVGLFHSSNEIAPHVLAELFDLEHTEPEAE
jgi:hypothetical protein